MKAEELAVQILSALHGGGVNASHGSVPLIEPFLRSYGLACAMKERERCAELAESPYLHYGDDGTEPPDGEEIANAIRSRPVGDELMKEIEG